MQRPMPFHAPPGFCLWRERPGSRVPGAFSVGQIAYDHFPFRVWSDLVTRHARRVRASSMNYSDPMGSEDFREVIAAYLRTARAVRCEASQIMVVNGSQHALDLSARVLLDPESPVVDRGAGLRISAPQL